MAADQKVRVTVEVPPEVADWFIGLGGRTEQAPPHPGRTITIKVRDLVLALLLLLVLVSLVSGSATMAIVLSIGAGLGYFAATKAHNS